MVKTVISSRALKNLTVTLSLENKKKWSWKSLKKVLNSVHKNVYEPWHLGVRLLETRRSYCDTLCDEFGIN